MQANEKAKRQEQMKEIARLSVDSGISIAEFEALVRFIEHKRQARNNAEQQPEN